MSVAGLRAGFADAQRQSQACFRAAMNAMARPGLPQSFRASLDPPAPLRANAAALALTLADFETTLWLDENIRASAEAVQYLTFHSGARLVDDAQDAAFALIGHAADMPPLATFAQGSQEYPDRSTTLIIQVASFGRGLAFEGPGVHGKIAFDIAPKPPDFAAELVLNRQSFPRGVDLIFASDEAIAALPRSVRLTGA